MSIKKEYKINFDTLKKACANGDLALLECTDVITGKPVIAICAVGRENDSYVFSPIAKMFDGNPSEELVSPK